jgi:hypothetical protein
MTGKRRREQQSITKLARGQPCEIRIPAVCAPSPDNETTVPCHYRLAGLSGAGFIPPAFMFAFGCFACHQYVDTHHDADTRLAHAEGVFRTLAKLKKMGVTL